MFHLRLEDIEGQFCISGFPSGIRFGSPTEEVILVGVDREPVRSICGKAAPRGTLSFSLLGCHVHPVGPGIGLSASEVEVLVPRHVHHLALLACPAIVDLVVRAEVLLP